MLAAKVKALSAEEYMAQHWIPQKIWSHTAWATHQRRYKRCAGLLVGRNFADVGCATGHSTFYMSAHREGNWLGVDFSETAIKKAREFFPNISFEYYNDIEHFGKVAAIVDSIVCSEVLEHVENDKTFLEILVAHASKRVVLTTPMHRVSDPGHIRLYTEEEIAKLCSGLRYQLFTEEPFFYIVIEI